MTRTECKKRSSGTAALSSDLRAVMATAAAAAVLIIPDTAASGVRAGLALCAQSVIPSLFVFLVLSPMLDGALRIVISRLAGNRLQVRTVALLSAFAVGMTAGFPIGALSILALYNEGVITKVDAARLIGICTGASPAFLIGYFGRALWNDAMLGLWIWCAQCAVGAALLFCYLRREQHDGCAKPMPAGSVPTLAACLRGAVPRMWGICASVVFFSVFRAILCRFLPLGFAAVLGGVAEMTGGLRECAALYDGGRLGCGVAIVLSAAMIGFGGGCVAMQVADGVAGTGISMRRYPVQRLLFAAAAALAAGIYGALMQKM